MITVELANETAPLYICVGKCTRFMEAQTQQSGQSFLPSLQPELLQRLIAL